MTTPKLPAEVADTLRPFHVYVLVDPRGDNIFYVGKGTKERLLSHTKQTLISQVVSEPGTPDKRARIEHSRQSRQSVWNVP